MFFTMHPYPIHSIVAEPKNFTRVADYLNSFDKFLKLGCDIDAKNYEGETAVHVASYFHNAAALSALLIAGADINIGNECDETAFFQITSPIPWRSTFFSTGSNYFDCTRRTLAIHVIRLQSCRLDVDLENIRLAECVFSDSQVQILRQRILKELEDTKFVLIGKGSLTLRDFLSETGVVASRPSITSQADREAIDKFFEFIDHERFPKLSYLFKLQYRKMLKRLQIIKEATSSVRYLVQILNGLLMPEICCRMLIGFLTNTEIKHLITLASRIKAEPGN